MFKLKIRNLNSDYGNTNEQLVADFLRSIGFLGNDGGRNKVTKRSQTGILLFTKCLIPNPKKSWTTSEIAKELGVPLQAIYRHLQWLREAGFLTEDFPGKAEDPKKVRLWHYDLNKAWSGVENRARICLETYREIINNLNEKLKEAKNEVPSDMINVGKEEIFEINLREVKVEGNSTYEDNLGILGRGIGLLSNHHYPY
ncbi:MAG: winged helix-turn-helix domain-containing protein, partial [Candidatus Thermoplasmatota archaeon]|nr:winged helix-turn-helix domain-containing protein [Candidatus Thermoplasmatota archaeon]